MYRLEILFVIILIFVRDDITTQGSLYAIGTHCRHFPFSRMCLGVAAKRSAQRFDLGNRQKSSEILSSVIRRLLEEEKVRAERESQMTIQDKSDLFDETPFLEQLESMVRNKVRRPIDQNSFIDEDQEWAENYDNSKGQL